MTTDDLLREIESRGLSLALTDRGPVLRGDGKEATPALLRAIRWHRQAIITRLDPAAAESNSKSPPISEPPPADLHRGEGAREFLWRTGHRYLETPEDEWLWGHADRWPVGANWWRWQGERGWRVIEGACNVAWIGTPALRAGQGLPAGEHLEGAMPGSRRPDSQSGDLAGPSGFAHHSLLGTGGLFSASHPRSGGADHD